MEQVLRLFAEKRRGFNIEAMGKLADLRENLMIEDLERVRILNRYDISGISAEEYEKVKRTILSEPNVDTVYEEAFPIEEGARCFAVEYLPGQYDQRADSAAQCVQLLTAGERPEVLSAQVYVLLGDISDEQFEKIKNYVINPVESREASME
ncbi:MAG: phosphoribosylformylglycinamidine synthase, partial [Clostridia bacterium]|nr:phosphoribosylformylglycinamidine synthase [Clostridia bacterium]